MCDKIYPVLARAFSTRALLLCRYGYTWRICHL